MAETDLDDDSPPPPSQAELVDRGAHDMLHALYADGRADIFVGADPAALEIAKKAAEKLVRVRLAAYPDEARDRLEITNSGRYWALNGGYLAFLKEDPPTGGGGRGRNPELEALRFNYMKLRMNTFWITFALSIAGFVMSIISLGLAFYFREAFLR